MKPIALLVVTDVWMQGLLTSVLVRMGCRVLPIGTAGRARSWIESHRPDLMVLDDGLPDGTAQSLVLLASAVHVQGRQPPAEPIATLVLHKPVQLDTLEAALRSRLDVARGARSAQREHVHSWARRPVAPPRDPQPDQASAWPREAPWIAGDWGDLPPSPNRTSANARPVLTLHDAVAVPPCGAAGVRTLDAAPHPASFIPVHPAPTPASMQLPPCHAHCLALHGARTP